MTEQEKNLLITDLCTRIKYGVKARYFDPESEREEVDVIEGVDFSMNEPEFLISQYGLRVTEIKPYLRPMSSMTEDEKIELKRLTCPEGTGKFDENGLVVPMTHFGDNIGYGFMSEILNFLKSKHLDYNGLIEKGLALEAPEGMY